MKPFGTKSTGFKSEYQWYKTTVTQPNLHVSQTLIKGPKAAWPAGHEDIGNVTVQASCQRTSSEILPFPPLRFGYFVHETRIPLLNQHGWHRLG